MGDFDRRPASSDAPLRPQAPPVGTPVFPQGTAEPALGPRNIVMPSAAQLANAHGHFTDPPVAPAAANTAESPIRLEGEGRVRTPNNPENPGASVTGRVIAGSETNNIAATGSVNNRGQVSAGGEANVAAGPVAADASAGITRAADGTSSTEASGNVRVTPIPGLRLGVNGGVESGAEGTTGTAGGSVQVGREGGPRVNVTGGAEGIGGPAVTGNVGANVNLPLAPGLDLSVGGGASGLGSASPTGNANAQLQARLNRNMALTAGVGANNIGGANQEVHGTAGLTITFP